jgi:drug/metabolite transporter (DMT)-like permease
MRLPEPGSGRVDGHGMGEAGSAPPTVSPAGPLGDAVPWRALAATLGGTVLISFSGIFVRLADVEPARSAFLRGAYALPVFVLLVLWARRRRPAGGRPPLRAAFVPMAALAGGLLGADLIAWHESIAILGAGLATVLPNLQVVLVGLAGVLLLGERPRWFFWVAVPAVLAGVWLLAAAGRPVIEGGSVPLGVAFGVLTAVFYAGYILVLRVARTRHPGAGVLEVMASATFGATVVTGVFAATRGVAAPAFSWPADGWLLALALGSQVIGWGLLASSIHRLPAALTAVTLLLQPALALVWGGLLLAEPIGAVQLLGAGVVLAGVVAGQRSLQGSRLRLPEPSAEGDPAPRVSSTRR